MAVFRPLRRRPLRRMVGAQFCSELGDGVVTIALPLYVYGRTGSALATALTFSVELLAGAIVGFVGGVLADGVDRQRILVASYVARALLLVAAWAADPLWLAIACGVLARASGQVDNPAFDSMVPDHALPPDPSSGEPGDLQQVLALRRLIQGVSFLVGPSVGAVAVELVGPRASLLVPAVAFAVALSILAPTPGLDRSLAERRRQQHEHTLVTRLQSMRDGVSVLLRTPVLRRLVLYMSAETAVVAVVLAGAVVWFEEGLDVSGSWYGISMALYGIGTTLGLAWAGSRSWRIGLPRVAALMAPIYAASNLLGVVALEPWLLGVGWLIWGIAYGPELVLAELLLVHSVPEVVRGRAWGAYAVIALLSSAAGYALAGPLLEWLGPRATLAWMSPALLALAVLWIVPIRAPAPTTEASPTASPL